MIFSGSDAVCMRITLAAAAFFCLEGAAGWPKWQIFIGLNTQFK